MNDKCEDEGVIDSEGFRLNVGIIIANEQGQLLWCRRIRPEDAWQFPQGGIHDGETSQQAMFRELEEELGLFPDNIALIAETEDWLSYRLPEQFIRHDSLPLCIGQKQKWYLLRLTGGESAINLKHSSSPEFDQWVWVDYWYPVDHVIAFKREVYQNVLEAFSDFM